MRPHSFHLWEYHCIVKIADVIKQSEDCIILYIFKWSLNSHISVFISIKKIDTQEEEAACHGSWVWSDVAYWIMFVYFFSSFFVIDMLYEQTIIASHSQILQLKCHMSFSCCNKCCCEHCTCWQEHTHTVLTHSQNFHKHV